MASQNRKGTVSLRQVSGSARSKKVRFDLGEEDTFTRFPAPVKVGDASYFLVRGQDGYKLLSTVCPHQGGEIMDEGDDLFVCDGHGWQYEKSGGGGGGVLSRPPRFPDEGFLGNGTRRTHRGFGARRITRLKRPLTGLQYVLSTQAPYFGGSTGPVDLNRLLI